MADFFESFDNGVGMFTHGWGNGIDTSTPGQVTISGNSGMMERPWSADSGTGYGTYTVTASLQGDEAGPAILLWPADDVWPGGEFDIAEIVNGTVYGVTHAKGSGGWDEYESVYYNGVDESEVHTYTLDWQPGSITYSVDGKVYGTVEGDIVGKDYDDGGVNVVFSAMNRNANTSVTVYDVSYTAYNGDVSDDADIAVNAGADFGVGVSANSDIWG